MEQITFENRGTPVLEYSSCIVKLHKSEPISLI
jgi:hypothetical protein